MPANWNPFHSKEEEHRVENPEVVGGGNEPTPQKTPAELIAESLKPFTDSVTSTLSKFEARLDEVAAATKRPERTPESTEVNAPPSVFDNEDAAFATRIGPVVAMQLETQARLNRADVRQEYGSKGWGDVWAANETEINQVLDNSPLLDQRGKPVRGDAVYIRNVVDMVIGRAAQKAGLKFGGKDKGFFVESAGGDGGSVGSGPVNDGLTADQRRIFARYKIKPEEGAKTVAKLKFIN